MSLWISPFCDWITYSNYQKCILNCWMDKRIILISWFCIFWACWLGTEPLWALNSSTAQLDTWSLKRGEEILRPLSSFLLEHSVFLDFRCHHLQFFFEATKKRMFNPNRWFIFYPFFLQVENGKIMFVEHSRLEMACEN